MKASAKEKNNGGKASEKTLRRLCRRAAAEGCVLLKNEGVLPFTGGDRVAVFGRTAFEYVASGTGSGGCVHPPYRTDIIGALSRSRSVKVDGRVRELYRKWLAEHPFDAGNGWATEPWFQTEFVPDAEDVARAARENDGALIVLGRSSCSGGWRARTRTTRPSPEAGI